MYAGAWRGQKGTLNPLELVVVSLGHLTGLLSAYKHDVLRACFYLFIYLFSAEARTPGLPMLGR